MVFNLNNNLSDFIHEQADAQLKFVIDLCNQNSYTYHARGTNLVADMILDRLEGFFPLHDVIRQTGMGHHHILRTRNVNESPGGQSIYLLGHMDTVFPPDHPFQECRREGDWLIGPGTGDMKGGLAVIVYALKALRYAGLADGLGLTLILSGDEEIGSATSHSLYTEETKKAGACLVAECGGPEGQMVISRNGKAGIRLDCYGQDRHVASVSSEKASAIVEIAGKILELEALNENPSGIKINTGRVEGGLGPGTVPGYASCLLDLRWEDEKHYEPFLKKMRRIIQEPVQPQCRCEMSILNGRPAMTASQKNRQLFEMLREVAGSAGIPVLSEHRKGTSDANFFGAAGVPTMDGFGPVCLDDHTPRERILVPSLSSRTFILAHFLNYLKGVFPL